MLFQRLSADSLSFWIPAHQLGKGRQHVLIFKKDCINCLGYRHLYAVTAAQFADRLSGANPLRDAAGVLQDVGEPPAFAYLLADATVAAVATDAGGNQVAQTRQAVKSG